MRKPTNSPASKSVASLEKPGVFGSLVGRLKRYGLYMCLAVLVGAMGVASVSASTLYSQPTNFDGAYASQNDTSSGGLGNFATAYDDFTLTTAGTVNNVQWVGSYFGGSPGGITSFTLSFYSNNNNAPGTLLDSFTASGNAGETFLQDDSAGNPAYAYTLNITPFGLNANTEYWLSIVPDLTFPPQWGWETGTGGDGAAYQCLFGTCGSVPDDLAFTLNGSTSHSPEPGSAVLLGSALVIILLGFGATRLKKLIPES